MSYQKIRAALETQLATVSAGLGIAWENVPFSPVAGVPYLKVDWLPNTTQNPTFGGPYRREQGFFQVMLCYPTSMQGSSAAITQAEAIRAAFPRGASFVSGGVTVQIDTTPSIAKADVYDDRYCIPVSVSYFAHIYT